MTCPTAIRTARSTSAIRAIRANVIFARLFFYAILQSIFDLPTEVIETVLLLLSPRDIARFCVAFPEFLEVICSEFFFKRHSARFAAMEGLSRDVSLIRSLFTARNYNVRQVVLRHCKKRTPSNHCWNCMLCPVLLTLKPWKADCYCVDHLAVWVGEGKLVVGRSGSGCKCFGCVDGCAFWTLGDLFESLSAESESDSADEDDDFHVIDLSTL